MVHYQARLDATFAALSDVTRRGVLERAGLVVTEKVGRVRTCRLGRRRLEEEAAWIDQHRQLWSARFDALDEIVDDLNRKEKENAASHRG